MELDFAIDFPYFSLSEMEEMFELKYLSHSLVPLDRYTQLSNEYTELLKLFRGFKYFNRKYSRAMRDYSDHDAELTSIEKMAEDHMELFLYLHERVVSMESGRLLYPFQAKIAVQPLYGGDFTEIFNGVGEQLSTTSINGILFATNELETKLTKDKNAFCTVTNFEANISLMSTYNTTRDNISTLRQDMIQVALRQSELEENVCKEAEMFHHWISGQQDSYWLDEQITVAVSGLLLKKDEILRRIELTHEELRERLLTAMNAKDFSTFVYVDSDSDNELWYLKAEVWYPKAEDTTDEDDQAVVVSEDDTDGDDQAVKVKRTRQEADNNDERPAKTGKRNA